MTVFTFHERKHNVERADPCLGCGGLGVRILGEVKLSLCLTKYHAMKTFCA